MKKIISVIVLTLILLAVVLITSSKDQMNEYIEEKEMFPDNISTAELNEKDLYVCKNQQLKDNVGDILATADLVDVTNGQSVRQTDFNGNSSGTANINCRNGTCKVLATFKNLPFPAGGTDFYEGWIVRVENGSPVEVVSTGELKIDEVFVEADKHKGAKTAFCKETIVNTFDIKSDPNKYNLYVLTIEPNDGDPAPAEHVVEGPIVPVN